MSDGLSYNSACVTETRDGTTACFAVITGMAEFKGFKDEEEKLRKLCLGDPPNIAQPTEQECKSETEDRNTKCSWHDGIDGEPSYCTVRKGEDAEAHSYRGAVADRKCAMLSTCGNAATNDPQVPGKASVNGVKKWWRCFGRENNGNDEQKKEIIGLHEIPEATEFLDCGYQSDWSDGAASSLAVSVVVSVTSSFVAAAFAA